MHVSNANPKHDSFDSTGISLPLKPDFIPNETLQFNVGAYYPELYFEYEFESDELNPYRFDVSQLQDSIELNLVDEMKAFHLPHLGKVNSTFGWRRGRVHSGIDLQIALGDSIYAAFDGVIRVSKYSKGYGNFIIIRHFNGLETLYAHLNSRALEKGDAVFAGDYIGQGGNTGRSTGAHLHFETRILGRPIDPELFIDFHQNTIKTEQIVVNANTFDIPRGKKSTRFY